MAVTLNASTSSGFIQTADTSGQLQLQANGTTVLTVNPANFTQGNIALGTAAAGAHEYNGYSPYFTPFGTSRGVLPAYQYYELNTGYVGSNVATAQSALGVGVTLASSTIYEFEYNYAISKTAGATSHSISILFGGTATINNIGYTALAVYNSSPLSDRAAPNMMYIQSTSSAGTSNAIATATTGSIVFAKGIVSINVGGTFIPQYILSAAPGGAYTTQIGSYMKITPLGASGANVNIGSWA
jgi:hypothetical protein